jgi:phosphatidylinositol alpha-1,6-mannosyltransferase
MVVAGEFPGAEVFDKDKDLKIVRIPLTFPTWGLVSLAGLKSYFKTMMAVRPLLRANGIKKLHCGRCLPEGVLGWLFKKWYGLPYLCYVYGEELNLAAGSRELTWLMRRVLGSADFVIAICENTVRIVREEWGVSADRIRLLYPGVDTTRYQPVVRNIEVRTRLGWGERPVLLTVSRLQKRKGHDVMIRSLQHIRKAIPNVLYAIVGAGEERSSLEQLVQSEKLSEHVRFHGQVEHDEMLRCYQQCDLFVLPNRQVGQDIEGFGMVLVEAQACGKPVVAGASGGTLETMNIPETGLIVLCDEPDQLAALVTQLLTDRSRLQRMGEAARRWAVERFDWTALAQRAQRFFEEHPR